MGYWCEFYMNREKRRPQPEIVFSRNYEELPAWLLGSLDEVVFAASTGPDGGLTAIKHRPMHLTTNEPDVEFIDEDEDHSQQSPCRRASYSAKSRFTGFLVHFYAILVP